MGNRLCSFPTLVFSFGNLSVTGERFRNVDC